jgi:hypothetical protein
MEVGLSKRDFAKDALYMRATDGVILNVGTTIINDLFTIHRVQSISANSQTACY